MTKIKEILSSVTTLPFPKKLFHHYCSILQTRFEWQCEKMYCSSASSKNSDQPVYLFSLISLPVDTWYIKDIYSFAVNTINIVIECNENISIFTSAKHE